MLIYLCVHFNFFLLQYVYHIIYQLLHVDIVEYKFLAVLVRTMSHRISLNLPSFPPLPLLPLKKLNLPNLQNFIHFATSFWGTLMSAEFLHCLLGIMEFSSPISTSYAIII